MSQRSSRDDVVDEQLERRVDGVVALELGVEVAGEDLDVPGLVHDLRRRVVLRVDPRHGLDDLRRADECPLLAVEELAHPPVEGLDRELRPVLLAPSLQRGALELHEALSEVRDGGLHLDGDGLDVDVDRPVEIGRAVPLRGLGSLVELGEARARALVVPGEDGVAADGGRVGEGAEVDRVVGEDRGDVVRIVTVEDPEVTRMGRLAAAHGTCAAVAHLARRRHRGLLSVVLLNGSLGACQATPRPTCPPCSSSTTRSAASRGEPWRSSVTAAWRRRSSST